MDTVKNRQMHNILSNSSFVNLIPQCTAKSRWNIIINLLFPIKRTAKKGQLLVLSND